jgi:hypothetical protein
MAKARVASLFFALVSACGADVLAPAAPVATPLVDCSWELHRVGAASRTLGAGQREVVAADLIATCAGPVYGEKLSFSLVGAGAGSILSADEAMTDLDGRADIFLTAGNAAATFVIRAVGPKQVGSVDYTIAIQPGADPCAGHCQNQVADCGESGIDCGGDCPSCVDPCDGHCQNGIADCGEAGVDCGGACPACVDSCANHCGNGVQDCDETGVDCGGTCPACIDPCANHCHNGVRDCGETRADCGGECPACPPIQCAATTVSPEGLYCEPSIRANGSINLPGNAAYVTVSWVCDDYCDFQLGSFIHTEEVHILIPEGQSLELPVGQLGGPGTQIIDITFRNLPAPHCGDKNLLTWVGGSITVTAFCVE